MQEVIAERAEKVETLEDIREKEKDKKREVSECNKLIDSLQLEIDQNEAEIGANHEKLRIFSNMEADTNSKIENIKQQVCITGFSGMSLYKLTCLIVHSKKDCTYFFSPQL